MLIDKTQYVKGAAPRTPVRLARLFSAKGSDRFLAWATLVGLALIGVLGVAGLILVFLSF
jgi:hypothetical protein